MSRSWKSLPRRITRLELGEWLIGRKSISSDRSYISVVTSEYGAYGEALVIDLRDGSATSFREEFELDFVGPPEDLRSVELSADGRRLDDLSDEIDQAEAAADIAQAESLETEREQLLAEIRRATGLGGRLRSNPNDPAERARKAVSARIRDAVRRVDTVAPLLAAHLDRSIQTGLQCSYTAGGDEASISWNVES